MCLAVCVLPAVPSATACVARINCSGIFYTVGADFASTTGQVRVSFGASPSTDRKSDGTEAILCFRPVPTVSRRSKRLPYRVASTPAATGDREIAADLSTAGGRLVDRCKSSLGNATRREKTTKLQLEVA
jgi:hypothetical protein